MPTIEICECRFRLSRPMKSNDPSPIELFFGEVGNEILSFGKDSDGNPVYEYPRIQFKLFESTAILLGINEGCRIVQKVFRDLDTNSIALGAGQTDVIESHSETRLDEIAVAESPVSYRFVTPWIALNQKNFQSYTGSHNQKFRKEELSRILTANCLGMLKSLGIEFKEWIAAETHRLTSVKTHLNDKGMIGFIGAFRINLTIPDYIGLGKSVARGFGAIEADIF